MSPNLSLSNIKLTNPRSGLATATALAHHNATVYLASRSPQKASEVISLLQKSRPGAKVHFLEMDLMDLGSIKKGVEGFLECVFPNDRVSDRDMDADNRGVGLGEKLGCIF
jgi:NAD(P)-dependent dehydrogenase (short-subunit alcohol dehydrogenase family)